MTVVQALRGFFRHIDPWSVVIGLVIFCGVVFARSGVLDRPSLRQGETGLRAAALNVVHPKYPAQLTQSPAMGVAVAQLRIAPSGIPSSVEILESPHPWISRAMEDALLAWRFPVVRVPGSFLAARVRGKITYYFSIQEGIGVVRTPDEQAEFRRSAVRRWP